MSESVSGVDAILRDLRESAAWRPDDLLPLADAVAAVHATVREIEAWLRERGNCEKPCEWIGTGTGWDRGYAAGRAAERDQAWRWTIHVCPKGHKSLEPPLNGVCWKCWPGGRGPAEEHTAIRVAEVRR